MTIQFTIARRSSKALHRAPYSLLIILPKPHLELKEQILQTLADYPYGRTYCQTKYGTQYHIELQFCEESTQAIYNLLVEKNIAATMNIEYFGLKTLSSQDVISIIIEANIPYMYPYDFIPKKRNVYLEINDEAEFILAIYGEYDPEWVKKARTIPGRKWNGKNDEIPVSEYENVLEIIKDIGINHLDNEDVKLLMKQRSEVKPTDYPQVTSTQALQA